MNTVINAEHAARLLQKLVAIPSINPMGREPTGTPPRQPAEKQVNDYICDPWSQEGPWEKAHIRAASNVAAQLVTAPIGMVSLDPAFRHESVQVALKRTDGRDRRGRRSKSRSDRIFPAYTKPPLLSNASKINSIAGSLHRLGSSITR